MSHPEVELHAGQEALTYGSYWVSFGPLDDGFVQWGYVFTLDEVRAAATEDVEEWLVDVDTGLLDGAMYGTVYSVHRPEGQIEATAKAYVWPIEARLFDMAREVGWDHTKLEEIGRFLLELAYAQQRAHYAPVRSQ